MPCVYTLPVGLCDGTAALSRREHYLPRGFGNFRDDPRLENRICDACQRRFSAAEDVLLHNSPEAFFREMVGQLGRRHHRKKNIFYEPTHGMAPLGVLAPLPGTTLDILWEPVGVSQCCPMSQIVAIDKAGGTLHLPFRPGVTTAGVIRSILEQKQFRNISHTILISNGSAETEEMNSICHTLGWGGTDRPLNQLRDGAGIDAEMRAFISTDYLRAIAKIGFHFFLQYFSRFSGMENEFDAIKRFIYSGSASVPIVMPISEQFAIEFQRGSRAKSWSHLLSAQSTENGIEARMQFFVGPEVRPLVWRVVIGKSPSRIIYPEAIAYGYKYFDRKTDDFHGRRIQLPAITRIVYPR